MKNKKVFMAILLVVSLIMVVGCNSNDIKSSDSDKVIKVGTSGGYHPFTFKNESDKLDGFEIDVWNAIAEKIDYNIEFVVSDFSGLFGMLDTGRIDTIANQITITPEREKKYLFATPYVYSGAQLIVKDDNSDIVDLNSLKGKKVGVSLGSNYEQIIKKFDIDNDIEVITYQDFTGSLQDVALGRIDAVMNDKLAGAINIIDSGLGLQLGGQPIKPLKNSFPFIVTDENRELVSIIDKAIHDLKNDGTLTDISNKWFGVEVTNK